MALLKAKQHHTIQQGMVASSVLIRHCWTCSGPSLLLPWEMAGVLDRKWQGKGKLCTWWNAEPFVILEQVGDTGVMYRTQPERGGHEQTLHRNATQERVYSTPSRSSTTSHWAPPVFYGFLPSTVTGSLLDELENAPRRSAWTNLGKPLAWYRLRDCLYVGGTATIKEWEYVTRCLCLTFLSFLDWTSSQQHEKTTQLTQCHCGTISLLSRNYWSN